jgi:hypothetical protein
MKKDINPLAAGLLNVMLLPKDKKKLFLQETFTDFTGTVLELAGRTLKRESEEESEEK